MRNSKKWQKSGKIAKNGKLCRKRQKMAKKWEDCRNAFWVLGTVVGSVKCGSCSFASPKTRNRHQRAKNGKKLSNSYVVARGKEKGSLEGLGTSSFTVVFIEATVLSTVERAPLVFARGNMKANKWQNSKKWQILPKTAKNCKNTEKLPECILGIGNSRRKCEMWFLLLFEPPKLEADNSGQKWEKLV